MEVQLFIPCFVNQFYPQVGINMLKLFKKANIKAKYNPEQSCCGQVAFNSGQWDEAKKMGTKFITDFSSEIPIVTPSASCAGYLKNYFTKLFEPGTNNYDGFEKLTANLFELSDFLVNKIQFVDFGAEFNHTVTFHDSCAGLREYHLSNEARTLLSNVKGLQLIEMKELDECCGFGGTFAVKHKYISQAMVQQKVENALVTKAEYLTSTETSCLMNIEGYIKKQKLPLKAVHFSDILVSGW